jgi:hypothetical protein
MNLTYLDNYCERLGIGGWAAEPLNSLTNIAFLIAAYCIYRLVKRARLPWKRYSDIYALILCMIAIGAGSGAWHIAPSATTNLMDVLPITLFINLYLLSLLRRLFRWKWGAVILCFVLLHHLNYFAATAFSPDTLHGTLLYLPTWAILAGLVVIARLRHYPFARTLAMVTLVWTGSLALRTADIPLCSFNPYGTHFLWHVLNSWVLYRLLRLLCENIQPQSLAQK